jgi:hypothetical protein
MFCTHCSKSNPDGATFCFACGKDLYRPASRDESDTAHPAGATPQVGGDEQPMHSQAPTHVQVDTNVAALSGKVPVVVPANAALPTSMMLVKSQVKFWVCFNLFVAQTAAFFALPTLLPKYFGKVTIPWLPLALFGFGSFYFYGVLRRIESEYLKNNPQSSRRLLAVKLCMTAFCLLLALLPLVLWYREHNRERTFQVYEDRRNRLMSHLQEIGSSAQPITAEILVMQDPKTKVAGGVSYRLARLEQLNQQMASLSQNFVRAIDDDSPHLNDEDRAAMALVRQAVEQTRKSLEIAASEFSELRVNCEANLRSGQTEQEAALAASESPKVKALQADLDVAQAELFRQLRDLQMKGVKLPPELEGLIGGAAKPPVKR